MKRDKLDTIFSTYIRTRDKWACQKCGKSYPEKSMGLHCSHHFSRRHLSIRWSPENATSLCYSCHQWFGGNPVEAAEWLKAYLGETELAKLRMMKNKITKWSKADKEWLYQDYKKRLAEMTC